MADLKISELSALAGANLVAADELAIVDDSASETKKITVSDLIANGVTVISDDTIPGAKILFAAGDIATAALADSAVTTAKVADDAVTAAKLADESTVDLVTTLPASGAFTGQLALDTDDNSLYAWDGSAWQSLKAPGSINTVSGSTTGEVNIVATTSGSTVTVSATLDDTTAAAQFLAGPTGAAGTVGYRAISGTDLPTATTSAKGGVIVNGNGLTMDSETIEIDNTVTASSTHHVVTYNAQGLVTGGRVIASADLPIATASAVGGVIAGDGLAVDASGNLSIDNTVTSGTYTKVTVSAQGVVTAGDTLAADDIPDHSAAKLTSGTIGTNLIANDAITAAKMADQSTVLFGGALGSDNVTIFPSGDYKGQMFWDETSEDLYIYTGSAFIPITVLSGNLVNAGAYDASTNTMSSVTTAGSSAGFSAGAALPAPAASNLNHYVVVDTSGTGSGAAPAVALAPPDMLLSQGVGTEYALIDVSNAIAGQTASNISFVASGNIAATDVQAALQELDTEKLQKAGDTMTGALGIGTASSIVFEGSSADDYETTLTVTDPTADRTITLPNVTGTVVTTGDTGSVTSTMITDGTIVNADINASAEIAVSKLANGTARQLLQTDAAGTGVEFTSNVDVPGTLDVTSAGTFDSTLTVTGLISADGKVSFPAGTAAAPSLYPGSDTDTGIYSPGSDQLALATNGTGRLFIDSSGRLLVGQSSSPSIGSGQYAKIFVAGYAGGSPGGAIISIARDEAASAMSSGDTVGELIFSDNTGGTFAAVKCSADAAPGTNDFPGRLAFSTTADGASSPTERMRIDSSGNVGIGVTSPARSPLHVHRNSTSDATIHLTNNSTGSTDSDGLSIFSGTATSGIWSRENVDFRIATNSIERVRIDSSGNVGIGTTSPAQPLDVVGNVKSTGQYLAGSTGAATPDYSFAADNTLGIFRAPGRLGFATGGTERATIDSSGRLLVGTSTSFQDSARLQLKSQYNQSQGIALFHTQFSPTASSNLDFLRSRDNFGGNTAVINGTRLGQINFKGYDGTDYESIGASIYAEVDSAPGTNDMPGRLVFSTTADGASSPTERMRTGSDGVVSLVQNQARFALSTQTGLLVPLTIKNSGNNTSATLVQFTGWNGSVIGSISGFVNQTTYATSSDYRLKENVVDLTNAIDSLKQLRPKRFNFIENPDLTLDGFLAHEAQQVVSNAVTGEHDEIDQDGDPVYQGMDHSKLVPLLTAALQEAIAKIETLEQRLTDAGIA